MDVLSKVQSSACCAMRTQGLLGKSISAPFMASCASAGTLLLQCLALLLQHRDFLVAIPVLQPRGRGKLSGSSQLSHSLTKHLTAGALHAVFVSLWL